MTADNDFSQTIDHLRQKLDTILENLQTNLTADVITLFLYDADTDEFDLPIGLGLRDFKSFMDPNMYPFTDIMPTEIMRDKKPFISNGMSEFPMMSGAFIYREEIISSAFYPIKDSVKLLGTLFIGYRSAHAFIEAEKEVVMKATWQAAAVISEVKDVFLELRRNRIHRAPQERPRFILKSAVEIERATSNLSKLNDILENTCQEIRKSLDFDFIAVQLIRPEEQIIETVHMDIKPKSKIRQNWAGFARHPLNKDHPNLQDIQAEVATPDGLPHIKISTGWYKKYDPWIYKEFDHKHFARVYVPIVLLWDEDGEIINDWFDKWDGSISLIEEQFDEKEQERGYSIEIKMPLPAFLQESKRPDIEIIGTVEAGYYEPLKNYEELKDRIHPEQAIRLIRLVACQALNFRRALLPYVLKIIVERAGQTVGADLASLHYLFDPYQPNPDQHHCIYEVYSGHESRHSFKSFPPHLNGLGYQAVQDNQLKLLLGEKLKEHNPKIYEIGIRAIAAFPLSNRQGVLYISFRRDHQFTSDEVGWVQRLAARAMDAIRDAINYTQTRDSLHTLTNLHSISQSLVNKPEASDLLYQIAGSTINIFAADVVTIHQYKQAQRIFVFPPDLAGRLINDKAEIIKLHEQIIPEKLLNFLNNKESNADYALDIMDHPLVRGDQQIKWLAEIEEIKSSAGILLKVEAEIVGLMSIYYRRPHTFSQEEQRIIDILASSTAIAIKNRRLLETLRASIHQIVTAPNLHELMKRIVEQAMNITTANLSYIQRLDLISQDLNIEARYPEDEPVNQEWSRIKVGDGITGWVAESKQPRRIDDVKDDKCYKPYFPATRSLLSVPLLDREGYIVGVLTVGCKQPRAFNILHQQMLEALADQAVIGIQNIENQSRHAAAESMATLGDLAGQWMHEIENSVGAIRVRAQDIFDVGDERSKLTIEKIKLTAEKIKSIADLLFEEGKKLQRWMIIDKQRPVNIGKVIHEALRKVNIPPNFSQNLKDLPDDLPKVRAGEQQLITVFTNLIQNAVDAIQKKDEGELSIGGESREQGGRYWVVVWVHDTGIGIAEENREKIFERNFSTKGTEIGFGFVGFGLWWTRTYIEKRLRGQLKVESVENQWTRFTVALPAYKKRENN